jgi:hypothetical protein
MPATSAAVISAAPATSAPWPNPGPVSLSSRRRPSTPVATPTGMLMKKIQCQLIAWVSTPPASRPIEPPAEATNA